MKISITMPAKFPAGFAAARYHDERGELARIVSPVPPSRSAHFGVSRERNVGLTPLGVWNQGFQRFGPQSLAQQHQLAFSVTFDAIASRLIGDCDVVNPWQSTALRTIRAAHRRGIPSVLEVASAHILTQARILREERARFGEGLDHGVVTPAVAERMLAEYAEADRIAVTSSFVRNTFVEHGVPVSKIAVVPYGIDPAPVPIRGHRDAPARLLFVGGVSLRKGIPYLFEAFRRVEADAVLRLVGRSHPRLIARLGGLPVRTELAGVKTGEDLASEYAGADVFVLPSVEDGFGLVTLEAMSAGLPVVVSDHAGSAEVVQDGVNGFVVAARDVDALASRLDLLLGDAALRRRMGAAARATAALRTWQTYGDERHDSIYAPLLGQPLRGQGTHAAAV
jgi:glycosyltransferase involved in cell wall biosynthesis